MTYVPATTPPGDNAIPNPSVEVDTWGYYNGPTRSTARGYAGSASLTFAFNASPSGTEQYFVIGGSASDAPKVTPGVPYQVTFRWWTDNPTGITVRCHGANYWTAAYASAGNGSTEGAPGDDGQLFTGLAWPGGTDWALYRRDAQKRGLIPPATAAYAQVYITIRTTATYTGNVWIDAIRLAPVAQGDLADYIDGSQPNCIWTGTPGRSASKRLEVPTVGPQGSGGVMSYGVEYLGASRDNALGDPITTAVTDGHIAHDLDRDVIGTCALVGTDATVLRTGQWVAVMVTTASEDGKQVTTQQRGLFRLGEPSNTGTEAGSVVEVTGLDITTLLHAYRFPDTYNIAIGTNVRTAIIALLALAGITRHAIPTTTRTTGLARSYKPGDPLTDALSSLTDAMGWYAIYATYDGRATTRPYRGLDTTAVSRTYTLGQDSQLAGSIVTERSQASFANVIIAVRDNPTLGVLKSVARNDDPRSPGSTTYPGGLGIVADTLTANTDVDQAALDRMAAQELAKRGTQAACTITTTPDLSLDVHDVVQIVADPVRYPHLQQAAGKWYVQAIDLGLKPSASLMTVQLRRTEVL